MPSLAVDLATHNPCLRTMDGVSQDGWPAVFDQLRKAMAIQLNNLPIQASVLLYGSFMRSSAEPGKHRLFVECLAQ
jgi:hypothetical protein